MMGARRIRSAEAASRQLAVRSHIRFEVVKGVAGEVVIVAGELWKRVAELDGVLKEISMRHASKEWIKTSRHVQGGECAGGGLP
jgi:hypothetical protein